MGLKAREHKIRRKGDELQPSNAETEQCCPGSRDLKVTSLLGLGGGDRRKHEPSNLSIVMYFPSSYSENVNLRTIVHSLAFIGIVGTVGTVCGVLFYLSFGAEVTG